VSAADEEEDNPPAVQISPVVGAGQPNADLKPGLHPDMASAVTDADAAKDALSPYVELALRWCAVQRASEPSYDWSSFDRVFEKYGPGSAGVNIPIKSLRIVDAPVWAADPTCVTNAQQNLVKMCSPLAVRDPDLSAFAAAVAQRYGPSNPANQNYSIARLVFWNEPNVPKNWGATEKGTKEQEQARAHDYSDRLVAFHAGAGQGDSEIKVDAGEIAAGSPSTGDPLKDSQVRDWATYFTNYNSSHPNPDGTSRNGNYNVLTIHAYSQIPGQIPDKVNSYRGLDGVGSVGVTEFAWGAGKGGFRCVGEGTQAIKFNRTVELVQGSDVPPVHRLVWFTVIDNSKKGAAKCPDDTGYYDADVKDNINTYGLYKRAPGGALPSFGAATPPRPLRDAFRCKAAGVGC